MKKKLLLLSLLCCVATSYGAEREENFVHKTIVAKGSFSEVGSDGQRRKIFETQMKIEPKSQDDFFGKILGVLALQSVLEGGIACTGTLRYNFHLPLSRSLQTFVFDSEIEKENGEIINGGRIAINMTVKKVEDTE